MIIHPQEGLEMLPSNCFDSDCLAMYAGLRPLCFILDYIKNYTTQRAFLQHEHAQAGIRATV